MQKEYYCRGSLCETASRVYQVFELLKKSKLWG